MQDPAGLLQAQPRLVEDARAWLEAYRVGELDEGHVSGNGALRSLVEQVVRMYVARLTGAAIHQDTVRRLQAAADQETKLATLDAVASALRAHRFGGDDLDDHSFSLRMLLVPEAPSLRLSAKDLEPRPTIVHALEELDAQPTLLDASPRGLEAAPLSTTARHAEPVSCVLRARSEDPEVAVSLARVELGLLPSGVVRLPSAPDEVIMGATLEPSVAVAQLVRAAKAILDLLPRSKRERVVLGLATVGAGRRDGEVGALPVSNQPAYVRALATANNLAQRGGLVALDERAFDAAEAELAEHPKHERHVDPAAAFGQDRWELCAFLERPRPVGREEVRGSIAEAIADEGDEPQLVLLSGPSGLGKTTLIRGALKQAGLDDERAPILWGAADLVHPTPFAPILSMVRALAGAPRGSADARARVRRLLSSLSSFLDQEDEAELLGFEPILTYLIGAGADEEDEALGREVDLWSARALRVAVRRVVLLLVRALARRADGRRPTVVITGAEGLDIGTRELLTFLARRERGRLSVVLVSSSKLRLPKQFTDDWQVLPVALAPLDDQAALEVVASVLGEVTSPEGAQALVKKAKGSPLALHHLVRFAVEGGMIRQDEAGWNLDALKPRRLPGSLERILTGRIARLPEDQRQTLTYCAALGHSFLPDAVEIIGVRSGMAADQVRRALSLLTQTGFLLMSGPRPGAPAFREPEPQSAQGAVPSGPFAFEHPHLRAAAEAACRDEDRARVHGLAAFALEELQPSGTRASAASLARHKRIAGDREGALDALCVAARRAVRLNNAQAALALCEQGIELCGEHDDDRRVVLLLELEKALEQLQDRDAQKDALKSLVRACEGSENPKWQGQALFRVARFNVFAADFDKAEAAAVKALERFRSCDDDRGVAQTLRVLALARFERRDHAGAVDALTAAKRHVPDDDRRAHGLLEHQQGLIRLEAGDALGALEHLLDALSQKRATGDRAGEAALLDAIADVYTRTGRLHTAREILAGAVELRARIGDDAGRAESLKLLAEIYLTLGEHERARELAGESQKIARTLGLARLERSAQALLARAHLWGGDAKTAETLVDGLRRRCGDEDPFAAMEATLLGAETRLTRARAQRSKKGRDRMLKTALTRGQEAAELGERRGFAIGQVLGAAIIGAVLCEQGEPNAALAYAQRATDLVRQKPSTSLPVEQVFLSHARILMALDDEEGARALVMRAVDQLDARAVRLDEPSRARFWSLPNRAELRTLAGQLEVHAGPDVAQAHGVA